MSPPATPASYDTACGGILLGTLGTSLETAQHAASAGPATASESGQVIGFNPAGPLDSAIRELAAEALATGNALRYLDSRAATVLAIGTCGISGHAVTALNSLGMDPEDTAEQIP